MLRPAVSKRAALKLGDCLRPSSFRRHTRKCTSYVQCRDDAAVIRPARTLRVGCVAQYEGCAALDRDFFHLSIGEKSDPFSIGRKEGLASVLSSRERHRVGLVEQSGK